MRKIEKSPNVPATLINAPVPTCAAEVKKEIYKADDVRNQLMTDQGRKCAYCECRVRKAYNDVEHYRPKVAYFWLGHTWQNLLYSCNECNRTFKKYYFPLRDEATRDLAHQDISREEPLIVNPVEEEPSIHIKYRRHEAVPCSDKGHTTIELFQLNDRCELVEDRKEIFEQYKKELDKIKVFESSLQKLNLSQADIELANEGIRLCNATICNYTALNKPFSGMLISQI